MSGHAQARALPTLIRFALHAGVPPDALLCAAGLDPVHLGDPAAGMPLGLELRLWDAAAHLTGDPDFGLHLAEWGSGCPEEHFDVLAFAVRSCATLGEHYRRMGRYVGLIREGVFLSLEEEPDAVRLVHGRIDGGPLPRHPVESMLTVSVLQARRTLGDDFAPREVRFAHASPAGVSTHERLFRAPVRFACPRNELVLHRADLDRPQRQAEPRLLAVLERQLEELLSRVPEARSFHGRVKRCMADLLLDGEPAIRSVAAKLQMSPRSLQRRLRDEGTSFAGLLADLRHDLARRHLQDPAMTIHEVAFLLGFAEASAFHRAFKRWTGSTPAEYQRSAREAARSGK